MCVFLEEIQVNKYEKFFHTKFRFVVYVQAMGMNLRLWCSGKG
jgi:hypothetical protein